MNLCGPYEGCLAAIHSGQFKSSTFVWVCQGRFPQPVPVLVRQSMRAASPLGERERGFRPLAACGQGPRRRPTRRDGPRRSRREGSQKKPRPTRPGTPRRSRQKGSQKKGRGAERQQSRRSGPAGRKAAHQRPGPEEHGRHPRGREHGRRPPRRGQRAKRRPGGAQRAAEDDAAAAQGAAGRQPEAQSAGGGGKTAGSTPRSGRGRSRAGAGGAGGNGRADGRPSEPGGRTRPIREKGRATGRRHSGTQRRRPRARDEATARPGRRQKRRRPPRRRRRPGRQPNGQRGAADEPSFLPTSRGRTQQRAETGGGPPPREPETDHGGDASRSGGRRATPKPGEPRTARRRKRGGLLPSLQGAALYAASRALGARVAPPAQTLRCAVPLLDTGTELRHDVRQVKPRSLGPGPSKRQS